MKVWLGRVAATLFLVGLAITTTLFLSRDAVPHLWRDFVCLPSYARQRTLPYATFISWVRTGRIKQILFSAEQAEAFITDRTGSYRIKLPELDPSWPELLDSQRVKIIELVPGSC